MPRNAVMKHMLTIYRFALFPLSTTVRNLSSFIVPLAQIQERSSSSGTCCCGESPLKLKKTLFCGSFFKKPKLCFLLWHAHRNSSCSNDGFSATFGCSCSNLTKGLPYLTWQYWLGILGVYLSVTSQHTVESRNDRPENA